MIDNHADALWLLDYARRLLEQNGQACVRAEQAEDRAEKAESKLEQLAIEKRGVEVERDNAERERDDIERRVLGEFKKWIPDDAREAGVLFVSTIEEWLDSRIAALDKEDRQDETSSRFQKLAQFVVRMADAGDVSFLDLPKYGLTETEVDEAAKQAALDKGEG